jgi:hypothetical protein
MEMSRRKEKEREGKVVERKYCHRVKRHEGRTSTAWRGRE